MEWLDLVIWNALTLIWFYRNMQNYCISNCKNALAIRQFFTKPLNWWLWIPAWGWLWPNIGFYISSYICLFRVHRNLMLVVVTHPTEQNGSHFADNIFKCRFLNEKFCILIQISLKFVPNGSIDNMSVWFQIMAWCRTGDKPFSEPMLSQFIDAYMCDIARRWVNSPASGDTIKLVNIGSGNGLVPSGTKPLPKPMLTSKQWNPIAFPWDQFNSKFSTYQPQGLFGNRKQKNILITWSNAGSRSHDTVTKGTTYLTHWDKLRRVFYEHFWEK